MLKQFAAATFRLLLVLPLVLAIGLQSAGAGPLIDPFGRSAYRLDEADWVLLKGAVRTVLEKQVAGATADWASTSSGKAGQATLLRTFTLNGMICGDVRHDFTKGGGRSYQVPFCKTADGSWKVAF